MSLHLAFEVFTMVITKRTVFWDVTKCSMSQHIRGTHDLHHQDVWSCQDYTKYPYISTRLQCVIFWKVII